MENTYSFLLDLSFIYIGSVVFAFIAKKMNQPLVLGYIIGGLFLGLFFGPNTSFNYLSSLLNGFKINGTSELIYGLSQIGVILLLFLAGLETNVNSLKKTGFSAFIIAIGGVLFSGFLIGGIYFLLNGNISEAMFMGVMCTATSVSVSVQTLKELGKLKSIKGAAITGAAIIDDIIGILLVAFLAAIFTNKNQGSFFNLFQSIILKIFVFFTIVLIIGFLILKIIKNKKINKALLKLPYEFIILSLILCFLLSYIAYFFGIATIIGAYFAGLIISMTIFKKIILSKITFITQIFFTPIFFVSIGLNLNLIEIGNIFFFGIILSIIAIITKILGCGLGARISGFKNIDSIKIGTGMIPRGEVTLIIGALGLSNHILTSSNFAVGVLIVLITAISTPILLKMVFNNI